MASTLDKFGIPMGGGTGRGGIIQPKAKHKFRVRVVNFGPVAGGIELSQQVAQVGRPQFSQESHQVHAYNSVAYYAGKHSWQTITLSLRDDVTNSVTKLVSHQNQKQMNHLNQTSPLAGSNYKFQMYVETLDGGDSGVLETWCLEGCWITNTDMDTFDYSTAEPMMINLTVQFDNATIEGGLMPLNPELGTGVLV